MDYGDRVKLDRILGMLGSAHAGERAAAALAAHRLLTKAGVTWWDLIGAPHPRRPESSRATVVRMAHEWGIDHAEAAQSRIRQLQRENEALRKENRSLRGRLVRTD